MTPDDVLRAAGRHIAGGVHPGPLLAMLSDEQRGALAVLATYGAPRPMTGDEVTMASALGLCRFSPGSFDKRFARGMAEKARHVQALVSTAQAALLRDKVRRYRRQLAADIVALAGPKPDDEAICQDLGMFEGRA